MKTFDELTMLLASVSTQQKEKYAGWTFEEIYNDLNSPPGDTMKTIYLCGNRPQDASASPIKAVRYQALNLTEAELAEELQRYNESELTPDNEDYQA